MSPCEVLDIFGVDAGYSLEALDIRLFLQWVVVPSLAFWVVWRGRAGRMVMSHQREAWTNLNH